MRNIDELNNLNRRSEDIKKYFAEMDLTPKQLKQRLEYAFAAFSIYDLILIMFLTMKEYDDIDEDYLKTTLTDRILSLITGMSTPDDYLIDYAIKSSDAFVDTTIKNQDDEYYSSEERAELNAKAGANAVVNYLEYITAKAEDKQYKTWVTIIDGKERATHHLLNGTRKKIDELFNVGGVRMRFPMDHLYAKDEEAYMKQSIKCRCKLKYSSVDKEV